MINHNAQHNGAVSFWLQQLERRVEAACSANRAQLPRAKTMQEVAQLGNVPVPPELRSIKRSLNCIRVLESSIERRLAEMIDAGLKRISAQTTSEAARKSRGTFMVKCETLRGKYAILWRRADSESRRIVYQLEKASKLVSNDGSQENS